MRSTAFACFLHFPRRLTPARMLFAEIIADGGCRNAPFTHGMADLIEAVDDIACSVQAGDAGTLMVVAQDTAVFGQRRSEHLGKLGVRVGSEGRIDAVEGIVAFRRIDDDAPIGNGDRMRGSIDAYDTRVFKPLMVLRLEL